VGILQGAHQCTVAQIAMPSDVRPFTTFITCANISASRILDKSPLTGRARKQQCWGRYKDKVSTWYPIYRILDTWDPGWEVRPTSKAVKESRPVVGSSKNKTRGRVTSATPTVVLLHCTELYVSIASLGFQTTLLLNRGLSWSTSPSWCSHQEAGNQSREVR
jgi:hypothetical protein